MKTMPSLILSALMATAAAAIAADMPPMQVTVSDASGRLIHRGAVNADGTFSTPKVDAGSYVVQLKSRDVARGERFALVASAGKTKVVAESVPGEKFSGGGVAMRIDSRQRNRIVGQVASATNDAIVGANVRIIHGHRYVWTGPQTGTNLPGQWVEEGTPSAYKIMILTPEEINKLQERTMAGRTP